MNSEKPTIKDYWTDIKTWFGRKRNSTLVIVFFMLIGCFFVFRGCGDPYSDRTEALIKERDSIRAYYERREEQHVLVISALTDTVNTVRSDRERIAKDLSSLKGQLKDEKQYSTSLAKQVRDARNSNDTTKYYEAANQLADQVDSLVAKVTKYELQVDSLTTNYNTELALKDQLIVEERAYSTGLKIDIAKYSTLADKLIVENKKIIKSNKRNKLATRILGGVAVGLGAALLIVL